MTTLAFKEEILQGIPAKLPSKVVYDLSISHAPNRKKILTQEEEKLAIRNALRYFPKTWHETLATDFLEELHLYGRVYMYRFRPQYDMYARPINEYPAKSKQAAAIMLMIQNNLDPALAQHPHELIIYGGNGAIFQNWAQYLITMRYLASMTDEQTLHMYSGHPMGLFPSSFQAPRVVITNGMMIPNYSKQDDLERYNTLGVTQYGEMTAGSYMYIGPQGIVHGTTITLMNAFRRYLPKNETPKGKIFLTSGLGGMSGAQPKAGNIVGCVTICAEVNPAAARKRHEQGWVNELIDDLDILVKRAKKAINQKENVSIAFNGNIVDVWEKFYEEDIFITVGTDQTSLHNPWSGGYYPVGLPFETALEMIAQNPEAFKLAVKSSLIRHVAAINKHAAKGTYFFDYGNAFLLESGRAGADILKADAKTFTYPSYVQDILGPMCFDYGFGPFRWVCTSGKKEDLKLTDNLALEVLNNLKKDAPEDIMMQMEDNIKWIEHAEENNLVVGSQARILYADSLGRIKIAQAFNKAIRDGLLKDPIVLGRDHHDVSGTDSPFRETSDIYDGSSFTADMAIQNVIGDSFRGATWVSIHNGGGVGWGEAINGGFGMVLDGSSDCDRKIQQMFFFDVNNGVARRAWARNEGAIKALDIELERSPAFEITKAFLVEDKVLDSIFKVL